MLGVRWQASLDGRHLEDERKVILLSLRESMAVEDGALDSAEKTAIEMKNIGALVDGGLKVVAESHGT